MTLSPISENFETEWPSPLLHLMPSPPRQIRPIETPPSRPAPTFYSKPEVRDSSGKGKGLFATERVPPYTEVLVDEALLSLAQHEHHVELLEKYELLPDEDQSSFDSLSISTAEAEKIPRYEKHFRTRRHTAEEARRNANIIARFMSNGFKTGDPYGWAHVIFADVSRINHSCTPNALSHYRLNTGTQHIITLREIQPGEEIEICYCQMIMTREKRQSRLQQWGFTCTCPACSGSLGEDYEKIIAKMVQWTEDGAAADVMTKYEERVRARLLDGLKDCIDMAKKEEYPWLRAALPKLYDELAILTPPHWDGKEKREVVAAKREAYEWFLKLNGTDHPGTVARYNERLRLETAIPNTKEPR